MAYTNNYNGQKQYGNGNNNGGPRTVQDNNVTSTGIAFTNEQAGKVMNFNYWGRTVTLEIAAVAGNGPITWDARKNAQYMKCAISFTSLSELSDICDEVLDSIKSNGSFSSVGIRVGSKRDSILEISNGENIGMPTGIYLVMYKGLDSSGRTNNMEFYPFDNTRYVRGYNHQTGAMREDISKVGEFKKFRKAVNAATEAFTMAQAHTIAELKKGDKMTTYKALGAIGAALGVDFTKDLFPATTSGNTGYTRNQNNGTAGSNYNRGGYNRNSGYQPKGNMAGGYQAPRQPKSTTFEQPPANDYQAALNAMANEPVDINLDISQLQGVDLNKFGG